MPSKERGLHGFYPGTFDPPHTGHDEIAKESLKHVDKVHLLPNPVNPKSKPDIADLDTRLDLLKLSVGEDPDLLIPVDKAWEIYKKVYQEHGVDEAIIALSNYLGVDPVHIVGQDVYEKRDHSNRKVLLVREEIISCKMVQT